MISEKDILLDDLKLFSNNFVVNWHEHVWEYPKGSYHKQDLEGLIKAAYTFNMDKLICSTPETGDPFCPIERMVEVNNILYSAIKDYPELIKGMCFVNPGAGKSCLDEIDRCINDLNMVGIKMYHQHYINDEIQYPVIEKCIELDIPILVHAGKLTYQPESQPRLSSGEHFASIAKLFPKANIIMAHLTGGGDWNWQLKPIKDYKNISIDISGSIIDNNAIEQAVNELGADRILFGTDGSICAGVGKMLDCKISDEDKRTILEGKLYRKFLNR